MQIPHLNTQRLLLRERTPAVLDYVFTQLSQEAQMVFLGIETEEDYQTEKQKYLDGYHHWYIKYQMWDLILHQTGELIGQCGFHSWYPVHQRAEVGYSLHTAQHEGQGLMTEALQRVITYGFETMKLHRIEAMVSPDNGASLRLLEKFGFRPEGHLREHYLKEGKLYDSLVLGLLRREWRLGG